MTYTNLKSLVCQAATCQQAKREPALTTAQFNTVRVIGILVMIDYKMLANTRIYLVLVLPL